ncbi:MAG: TVP38/TMEM64 family protein [Clostridiaceae bacterium]
MGKFDIRDYKSEIVLGILLLLFAWIGYEYYYQYRYLVKNPRELKEIIMSYGRYGILVFILMQVIQVIVFFIPGEIVQIAGGYIYGTVYGSLISLVGICLGGLISYSIARVYGKPFVYKIISKKQVKHFHKILSLGSINYIVFLLYLIPGIPKDALGYICGISSISFKNFALYSTLARIPGIIVSAYFGANIGEKNTAILILIAISMSILFIIGVLKGEKIIKDILKKDENQII